MAAALDGVFTRETLTSLRQQYKKARGQVNTPDCANAEVLQYAEGDHTGRHQLDKIFYVSGVHALSWLLNVPFHSRMVDVLQPVIGRYKNDSGEKLGYSRGPPKSTGRMGVKITDYMDQPYPRSACLIDALRGTVCVETAKEVLGALQLIKDNFKLCRIKGKYSPEIAYNNVMVNLVFEYRELSIIAEVQITTIRSLEIKTLQHKFYDILRRPDGSIKPAAEAHDAILSDVCK